MDPKELLRKVDHTLLRQTATWNDIRRLCSEGIQYHTASVCLPPCFVKQAKDYVSGRIPICTVIGFPNGYNTTAVKCFEAKEAVRNGADELDMVINLGWVKEKAYDKVLEEIQELRQVCEGRILKVIVETCLLSEEEKIRLCEVVSVSGADFIKTSTGFSTAGAAKEDVALFKAHGRPGLGIKAAGGISTLEEAEEFLKAGASRLGSSRIVPLVRQQEQSSGSSR